MSKRDANWAWDLNWQTGALSALCSDNDKGPTPEAQAGWNTFLKTLPKGATILDICTGNGFIPALINKFSFENGSNFVITGVDQAAIDPHATVKAQSDLLKGVTFHGGVSAEALPFPDASFDAITGQYALEYTDITRTGPDLFRVLKSGGKARFVIHATESPIVTTNTPKIEQYEFILTKSGLLETLGEAAKLAFDYADSGDPALKQRVLDARTKLRDRAIFTKQEILKIAPTADVPQYIDEMIRVYISRGEYKTWDEFEENLKTIRDQLESLRQMLKILPVVAKSQIEMGELKEFLATIGFADFSLGDLRIEGNQLHGWTLECVKPKL